MTLMNFRLQISNLQSTRSLVGGFLLMLAAVFWPLASAPAATTNVQFTLAITNTVPLTNASGATITLNGNTVTWTNASVSSLLLNSRLVAATNTPAKALTNLFTKLQRAFTNQLTINYASSTSLVASAYLQDTLSANVSTGWATLTFTTNSYTTANSTGTAGLSNLTVKTITLNGTTISDWSGVVASDTNILSRSSTNFSFGSGRYTGPIITDGGTPLPQNNGWGSVDFQTATKPDVDGGGANTNSIGGIACNAGGGWGNQIYQTQECYDANGWKTYASGIGSGRNNTMINVDTCGIGIGDNNYIGPSPGNPQNYVDDSFIPFGIGCAIFDSIDAGAMGWACTNNAGGGSWAVGWHCWLDGGGTLAWGENVWNRGTSHGIVGIGKNILQTNAANSFVFGQNIKIDNAYNAGAVGLNITNTGNHGDYQFGVGDKAITVKSNGNLVVQGNIIGNAGGLTGLTNLHGLGATNSLTIVNGVMTNRARFTSVAQSYDVDTVYTNGNQQAFLTVSVNLQTSLGSGDTAIVQLLIDQDANGSIDESENLISIADIVESKYFVLHDLLQPRARFILSTTNLTGFGVATVTASRLKPL